MKLTKALYLAAKQDKKRDWEIRLDYGLTKEELQEFKQKEGLLRKPIPQHLRQQAQELGLSKDAVYWRMEVKGWTMEEACTTPKDKPLVTQKQLKQARKKHGLTPSTIYRRINRGWTVEAALNTPNLYKNRKDIQAFMRSMTMDELIKAYRKKKQPDVSVFQYIEELREHA
jgi:hypothetical protein